MKQNRRDFIKTAQHTVLASALVSVGSHPILGANERIRMGGIGVGDRGTDRLRAAQRLGAKVVALCDVNELMLDRAQNSLGGEADRYSDHRKILERKDIDAFVLATPDHWHHDIFLDAMEAGKDVYQEKPLSHTIEEGKSMVEAAQKTDRVVQIGNHRRSGKHWHDAYQLIKEGVIGDVKWVRTYDCRHWADGDPYQARGHDKNLYNPDKLDWERFQGNAPKHPYHSDRASAWRWYWDYAGGLLTDIGAHNIDVAMWMTDSTTPKSVVSNGNVYHLDFWETPDICHTTMDFGHCSVDFTAQFVNGFEGYGHTIYGTKGTLVQVHPTITVYLHEKGKTPVETWEMNDEGIDHMRNFLECVKSREETNSPIETAHQVITACHWSNIAYRENRKILL